MEKGLKVRNATNMRSIYKLLRIEYVALSGLGSELCLLTQDFDSLRPELLHIRALPFYATTQKILKGLNVIAQGEVLRNPEIKI